MEGSPTKVHVEETVWVDGGFIWRRRVVRMMDVWVFVGCVGWRRLLEVKGSTLSIIGQMQRSETGPEGVRAVVKARHSSAEVEVVHCVKGDGFSQNRCLHLQLRCGQIGVMLTVATNQRLDPFPPSLTEPVHHEEQQGEDEEGGDAADDQPHPARHGVEQTVST